MSANGVSKCRVPLRRWTAMAVVLVLSLALTGCSTTTGEDGAVLVTRDQMTQKLISAAKEAVTATGIELTYANIVYFSCAADSFSSPSYALLNAGFPIQDTPELAEAQIDGWAPKLVAAGWTQTPLSTSKDVEVKDRIFAKDDLGLFLTPWAKTRPQPPNVFTVRSKCVVDADARPQPQDLDVLPQINA